MDFETQDQQQEAYESRQSDAPSTSDAQEEPPVAARQKTHRLPIVLGITLLILIVVGAVVYALRDVHVRIERADGAFAFIIESKKQDVQDIEPTERADPAAYLGTGKTMTVVPSPPGVPNRPSSAANALSLQEIYEKASPCVALVRAERLRGSVVGIGVILSEDGYLITNACVVDRALKLLVTLNGGEPQEAVLVGSDAAGDIAVLKIEASGLTTAVFGDSDTLRVGDLAVAMEAPAVTGLSCAISNGIISGIDRDVTVNGRQMTLIRTNIPSSGNAGGPIFNCYGQVVALRTPMYVPASNSTGYAIPVSAVKPVVDELMERGFVTDRPSIGVSVEEIPDRVRIYYGLPGGVYVASVQPGSGAEKAGVRAGDILTALNDQSVTSAASLEQLRNNYAAGDVVMLTIYRSGEYLQLPVSLTQQEQSS